MEVVPRVAPAAAVLVLRLGRVPPAPLVVPRQAQAAAALGVVEVRQLVEPASKQTGSSRVREAERASSCLVDCDMERSNQNRNRYPNRGARFSFQSERPAARS